MEIKNDLIKCRLRQSILIFSTIFFVSIIFSSKIKAQDIYELSKFKTDGENAVIDLKSNFKQNSAEFKKGKQLYSYAQSSINAWIDRLKYELTEGKNISDSKQYDDRLKAAQNDCEKFLKYTASLNNNIKSFTKGFITLDIIKPLGEIGLDFYKEYHHAEEERRKELKSQLESFKWKRFDKVK